MTAAARGDKGVVTGTLVKAPSHASRRGEVAIGKGRVVRQGGIMATGWLPPGEVLSCW